MYFYEELGEICALVHKVELSQNRIGERQARQDKLLMSLRLQELGAELEPAQDELVSTVKFLLKRFVSPSSTPSNLLSQGKTFTDVEDIITELKQNDLTKKQVAHYRETVEKAQDQSEYKFIVLENKDGQLVLRARKSQVQSANA